MQIIAQRTSTAPNRPWRLFLMLFLNMRAARLSKRGRPFASTSGGCDRSSCQPRSAKMCRVTRRSFANTTPAVVRRPKSHATPVCLREGLRERTCVRLVSFSKPRGTFCGLREAPPSVYLGGPCRGYRRGQMEPRTPSCSPGYRCHGSDSILISLNAVSCILERRSNGQCIIDRCKTGVVHLTDEECVCVPIKPLPVHVWLGRRGCW